MLIQHGNGGRDLNLLVSGRRSLSLISGRDESCVLVFVGRASVADDADLKVLQELFSFTPAEAKLALGLAKGMPLGDVESQLNIRHNTARAHLRSMFLKADVSRQSELVHLLANSLAPLGRPLDQSLSTVSQTVN
jgi:DNA-binding CsgD family transcriptional regulator